MTARFLPTLDPAFHVWRRTLSYSRNTAGGREEPAPLPVSNEGNMLCRAVRPPDALSTPGGALIYTWPRLAPR
jgi:hypothetical protein